MASRYKITVLHQTRKSNSLHCSLNARQEGRTHQHRTLGIIDSQAGEATPLTLKYPSSGFSVQFLHHFPVFPTLIGQRLGRGLVSGRIQLLTFLNATRLVGPFLIGTRAQGYVVWVILVGRFRVLLMMGSMVMYVVEDRNDGMRSGIRIFSQCTVNQKLGIRTNGHVAYAADVVGRLARGTAVRL